MFDHCTSEATFFVHFLRKNSPINNSFKGTLVHSMLIGRQCFLYCVFVMLSSVVRYTDCCSSYMPARKRSSANLTNKRSVQKSQLIDEEMSTTASIAVEDRTQSTLTDEETPNPAITTLEQNDCDPSYDLYYCLNGGKCRNTTVALHFIPTCLCPLGFWGERCDVKYLETDCHLTNTCPQKGSTIMDGEMSSAATTPIDRSLVHHTNHESCTPPYDTVFCLNGGHCTNITFDDAYDLKCECANGFYGNRCTHKYISRDDQDSSESSTNRLRQTDGDGTEAASTAGSHRASRAVNKIDAGIIQCNPPLDRHYCDNGGMCINITIGENFEVVCKCAAGFMGRRCFEKYSELTRHSERSAPLAATGKTGVAHVGLASLLILLVIVVLSVCIRLHRAQKLPFRK